jgi:hypothetical protein
MNLNSSLPLSIQLPLYASGETKSRYSSEIESQLGITSENRLMSFLPLQSSFQFSQSIEARQFYAIQHSRVRPVIDRVLALIATRNFECVVHDQQAVELQERSFDSIIRWEGDLFGPVRVVQAYC